MFRPFSFSPILPQFHLLSELRAGDGYRLSPNMSFLALISPTPNTYFPLSAGYLQLNDLLVLYPSISTSLTKFKLFSKLVLLKFLVFASETNIVPTTQH